MLSRLLETLLCRARGQSFGGRALNLSEKIQMKNMSSLNNYVVILPGDGWGGRGGQKKVSRFLCSDLGGRAGGLKDHTWGSSRYWRRPSLPLGVTNLLGDLFALRHLLDLPHGLEAFLGCEGVALSLVTPDSLDSPLCRT